VIPLFFVHPSRSEDATPFSFGERRIAFSHTTVPSTLLLVQLFVFFTYILILCFLFCAWLVDLFFTLPAHSVSLFIQNLTKHRPLFFSLKGQVLFSFFPQYFRCFSLFSPFFSSMQCDISPCRDRSVISYSVAPLFFFRCILWALEALLSFGHSVPLFPPQIEPLFPVHRLDKICPPTKLSFFLISIG